jgi:radical SAM superfamily enzyme YgiQ (UPF0313 family)
VNPTKHSITWEEIQKARQRLARESGAIIKDWGGKLPFAFVYPNSYYIGMSNLGLQAIYGLLNSLDETVCERVFWDTENSSGNTLPVSVESQRPLSDFSVLAFSLNYEIDYFNIVPLLKASGIPLYSADRDATQPLIIAGGPCITANPMPVAPFFDCQCIGEAEALLPLMLPVVAAGITGNRDDLLKALARIPGILVPRYASEIRVSRQWVKELDAFPVHSIVLTQNTELHDLYLIEIERGCVHDCRFCLVGSAFRPVRFRSLDNLVKQAEVGLQFRKRLGLVGPAVTDHPQIEEIFRRLLRMEAQFSISSLRISSLTPEMLEMLVKGGLRSVALAPEAGSEGLRRVIKKGLQEEEILQAISNAAEKGMQQIKLYFMIGLPSESDDGMQSIVDLTLAGKNIIDKKRHKTRLTVNLSPFVPKAGTPFQWLPMASLDDLQRRISMLKNALMHKGIQIKNESPQWSQVQTVLSRGDADLAGVLADMDKKTLPEWRQAMEKRRLDIDWYAHQRWNLDQHLPWAVIDSGAQPEKLAAELMNSQV